MKRKTKNPATPARNYSYDINSFYSSLDGASFREITLKKLLELKYFSKEFNNYWNNEFAKEDKLAKYVKIMNKIKTNPKEYRVTSEAEKFILFMYCVDPTFELFKIWGECNTIKDIKEKTINKFGVMDKSLYCLEMFFIKNFLPEQKRNQIYEEINDRVYGEKVKKK